jgi:hypothetical protein
MVGVLAHDSPRAVRDDSSTDFRRRDEKGGRVRPPYIPVGTVIIDQFRRKTVGQDLTYRAGDAEYEYRISRADWDLMKSLREHLPEEIGLLFEVPELGAVVNVPTDELRAAADRLEAFFSSHSDLLPYTYQFSCERTGDPYIVPGGFSTGGMSGLRLPGDDVHYYFIRAGFDECSLEKSRAGPDGRGVNVDRRDLRGERELLTENMGKIRIRRRRARTELRQAVAEIKQFLRDITSPGIAKSVG